MSTFALERKFFDPYYNVYRLVKWNRSPKPYLHPLAYYAYDTSTFLNTYGYYMPSNTWLAPFSSLTYFDKQIAENQAADRLLSSIGDKANVLLNVVERRQSINMISKRLTQITSVIRDIRKGRFIQAAKKLGIKKPKGVSRSKQFANNFLEYHFGWSPLIGDIYTAGDILQQPIKRISARGRGLSKGLYASGSYPAHPPGKFNSFYSYLDFQYRVETGCRVASVNPDLWLMNQMGIVNPAVIAWEAVPFSFVADWFTGFGAYLEGLTGTVGLTIEDGYTTRRLIADQGVSHRNQSLATGAWDVFVASGRSALVERTIGHLSPQPTLKFDRVSLTRGLTAISLLIQQMKR